MTANTSQTSNLYKYQHTNDNISIYNNTNYILFYKFNKKFKNIYYNISVVVVVVVYNLYTVEEDNNRKNRETLHCKVLVHLFDFIVTLYFITRISKL